MNINLFFRKDSIIAGISKGKKFKQMMVFEHENIIDSTGAIQKPVEVADFLIAQLQDKKITPKSVGLSLDRAAVISFNLTVTCDSKKLLDQMVRLAMDERYPGTLEANKFTFKIIGQSGNKYDVVVMVVPTAVIETYIQFIKNLKLKVDYIETVPSVFSKVMKSISGNSQSALQNLGIQTLAISLFENTLQVLVLNNYEVTFSNTMVLPSYAGEKSEEERNKRIITSLKQIIATLDENNTCEVYIEYDENTSKEAQKSLEADIHKEIPSTIFNINENYQKFIVEAFDMVVHRETKIYAEIDFKNSIQIDTYNSYVDSNKFLRIATIIFALVSVGVTGTYGYLTIDEMLKKSTISENTDYIKQNESVNLIVDEKIKSEEQYEKVFMIDQYLTDGRLNYEEVQANIYGNLQKHDSTVFNISISETLEVQVDGQAESFENVANLMDEFEVEGSHFNQVLLSNISVDAGIYGSKSVYFSLTMNYDLASEVSDKIGTVEE